MARPNAFIQLSPVIQDISNQNTSLKKVIYYRANVESFIIKDNKFVYTYRIGEIDNIYINNYLVVSPAY